MNGLFGLAVAQQVLVQRQQVRTVVGLGRIVECIEDGFELRCRSSIGLNPTRMRL